MFFPTAADIIGTVVGIILSLFVLSYLVGDNPLFRFSVHLLIGVSAGLAAAVMLRNVIIPQILLPLLNFGDLTEWLWSFSLFVLGVLLLAKLSPRFRRIGNVPMAYIVGVGAAVAVVGAVLGTLIPQVDASTNLLEGWTTQVDAYAAFIGVINRVIALIGTAATLAYFHFGAKSVPNAPAERAPWIENVAMVGRIFIAITFGVLFAGVISAALAALIERISYFWLFIKAFL